VRTLLHATVYFFFHNLLNVLVQIANKMELQKKKERPLACAKLSIEIVLEFLCWKWKPYNRVVFRKYVSKSVVLNMRSL
jgi:hypothetical protein